MERQALKEGGGIAIPPKSRLQGSVHEYYWGGGGGELNVIAVIDDKMQSEAFPAHALSLSLTLAQYPGLALSRVLPWLGDCD